MISIAIMAHRSRERRVQRLSNGLLFPEVAWAEDGEDVWANRRRALLLAREDEANPSSHHLIVQDDAILCDRFLEYASSAIKVAGPRPVSFYCGTTRPYDKVFERTVNEATTAGLPWVASEGPLWGVAVAVPVEDIMDIIEFGDRLIDVPGDDIRMAAFYRGRAAKCWYTNPSLVDHLDEESLINPGVPERRARRFEQDPGEIDWTRKPSERVVWKHKVTGATLVGKTGTPMSNQFDADPDWEAHIR